ncbi:peptidase C48, SUMO/sentrin/Ubl1 [Tanacetum coccineum]
MNILSEKKKERGQRSKYIKKPVDPSVALTEDENLLGRSIFSTQEEEEEEVFNDDEGLILFRMNIQSLAPGLEIDTSVIDVYVSILNYEEKFKMMNMKRHFFYTSMMVPGILEDKTTEIDKKIDAQYERFHEMLLIQMENDVEKMQMEDVELAFFPIIAHGHYYLIVFNLKTGKSVIIDNSESDATYEGKYKDNVEFVRSVFGRHLLMYQNTNADKILTGSKKATNLRMKWKTTKEKIDCGLYMIMHMELYEGSTAAQWKTSLLPEKDKNHRMQMDNLRSRIAAKILLHEVNIHKKKMSDYAKKMTGAGEGGSNQE